MKDTIFRAGALSFAVAVLATLVLHAAGSTGCSSSRGGRAAAEPDSSAAGGAGAQTDDSAAPSVKPSDDDETFLPASKAGHILPAHRAKPSTAAAPQAAPARP